MNEKPPIAFVIDRVMHYHRATLHAIEVRLEEHGIPFHVFSSADKGGAVGRVAERKPAVRRHHFFELKERQLGGFVLRRQVGLARMVADRAPAVVVSTSHSGTVTEWTLLRDSARRGARSVAWQCGYEYNPGWIKRAVLARFVPKFDFHLCYHSNAQRYALQHGAHTSQTLVMHNTIDERRIAPRDTVQARQELINKHPQLASRKIVLYVGAVLEEKRLELVFEALELANDPQALFLIVGDGPHLAQLQQRYAARPDCLFVGQVVEGVGEYFDAADVFVLPGTGGLAINEAMAHRLPVISAYADGSADDLVVDGITGYRLQQGTATELADRLRSVLGDPSRARTMGLSGEQRIRGELSFERFIERVVGVLLEQYRIADQVNRPDA